MMADIYISFFEKQLERVNYWLAYSETKNAAMIALNVAMIAALTAASLTSGLYKLALVILLIAILVSLISFWPYLGNTISKKEKTQIAKNFIYFKDISYIDNEDSYVDYVNTYYFDGEAPKSSKKWVADLAKEIIYNSRLASQKFLLFRITLALDIASGLFIGIQFLLLL